MTKDEALRLALEALEYQGPSWIEARQPTITAIKAALEAKDEPDQYAMDIECTKCGAKQSGVLTVHTAPPQRTWVGLTDKDWKRSKHTEDFEKGVDWSEAMLKAKNT